MWTLCILRLNKAAIEDTVEALCLCEKLSSQHGRLDTVYSAQELNHRGSTGPAEYFPEQLTSQYGRQ